MLIGCRDPRELASGELKMLTAHDGAAEGVSAYILGTLP